MMHFLDRIKRYDEDIAQFVHEVDLAQSRLENQLCLEERREIILSTQALLETPLGKDLQAIALFVETGEGNPWIVNTLMKNLLRTLFSFPYVPGEPQSIPAAFWLHPVGGLLIKAQCRIFDDQLITIAEAARLARVSSATVSIAIDKGDLIGVTDPSARRRQGHRRVLRSEVIARWVDKVSSRPAPSQKEWSVYEHRVAGGNQVVVVLNGVILNQWIHHFSQKQTIQGQEWQVLGTERHEQGAGNPEWVGQPVAILAGKHFRQVRIPDEITHQLHTHFHLGGGKTASTQTEQADA